MPVYIESYVKSLREGAKKLKGFQHLRMFPIEIGGNLTMEYSYTYWREARERGGEVGEAF